MNQDPTKRTGETECDLRLPSGVWAGFYLEPHHLRRGWMHLYINFGDLQIEGEGTDYVGPWSLSGTYDLPGETCDWTKQYIGKHQVHYQGKITKDGILGTWNIQTWHQGRFHIWPQARMDLQNRYMAEEMDRPNFDTGRD